MKIKNKTNRLILGSLFDKPDTALPKESKTTRHYSISTARKRYEALTGVPEAKKESEYLAVVRRDGMKLRDVPDDYKTSEICLAAVKNNRFAFQFVPEKFKSIEACVASLQVGWFNFPEPYKHIPEEIQRTEEFWDMAMQRLYLDAVKISGTKLERMPEEGKTPEVCLIAVRRWGRALQFVPEKLKTPGLCLAAVQQDNRAIKYVPKSYLFQLYANGILQNNRGAAIAELQRISKHKFNVSD